MVNEVVVVFGAHPDDLDWACGGTTAAWTREGKEVYFVLTTSGESGEDHQRGLVLPPAEIAEIREAEQRLAANILGVKDVIFLGQPDGRVEPTLAFRDQLVNVLRRLRPQIVISMDPGAVGFRKFLSRTIPIIGPRPWPCLTPSIRPLGPPRTCRSPMPACRRTRCVRCTSVAPGIPIRMSILRTTIELKIQALTQSPQSTDRARGDCSVRPGDRASAR